MNLKLSSMKKALLLFSVFFSLSAAFAQAPEKMSYQSVIRNASNALVANQAVGMKISILQGSASGTVVYAETQTPTTNSNGLVSLEIGAGTTVSGTFSSINWANGPYFAKTETDPTGGTSYSLSGTSQLLTVPYALYAKTSGSSTPGPQGATGSTGPQGPQGATGAQGPQGLQGPAGTNGTQGIQGLTGPAGAAGTNGTNGQGVPTGGTANQVLAKVNGTDFNTQWVTPAAGSASQLELLNQGGNTGWRMLGATPANYGNIGLNAIDISTSNTVGANGATGLYSFASGVSTKASGNTSTAMGNFTTASGTNSNAMGNNTTASGQSSTAMGNGTTASAKNSTAMGNGTLASGQGSTAMGFTTTASAATSTAMGLNTIASGQTSTAMGSASTASGYISTAMGYNSKAIGDFSTAMGAQTTAQSASETVLGQFNDVAASPSSASWTGTAADRILTVGNGTISAPKSALVILQNGNTGIGTSTPSSLLHVKGAVRIEDGTQAAGKVLTSDANGLATWATPAAGGASQLELLSGGGWRMLGANPTNYGTIGYLAKDLSFSNTTSLIDAKGAIGMASFASGLNTKASGTYSTAMGSETKATGDNSTAMGNLTNASGYSSTAMGDNTTASGQTSTAMGSITTASADYSTAMGSGTTASGLYSTAMGENSTASGDASTASGNQTTASGKESTALGSFATASGNYSTALGSGTTASGIKSTAMGNLTNAQGFASNAMGNVTTAKSATETVLGQYNDEALAPTSASWTGTAADRIFTVGNGTNASNKKSALVILQNGNTGIGTSTPSSLLHVKGAVRIEDGTQAAGKVLTSDANGLATWTTPAAGGASQLELLAGGGWRMLGANPTNYGTIGYVAKDLSFSSITSSIDSKGAIGVASFASGFNTKASGNYSTAMCEGTTASGFHSTAMGYLTKASGENSTAMGNSTTAKSQSETVLGQYNDEAISPTGTSWTGSTADRILTVGIGADASTKKSALVILQNGNTGIGTSTPSSLLHVKGAVRIEDGSQAAGKVLTSDANGLATWTTPAAGGASQLELLAGGGWALLGRTAANYGTIGYKAIDLSYSDQATATLGATGTNSFASGGNTKASGNFSTAMGYGTTASAGGATAIGYSTTASGNYSTAMGRFTTASADYSTAMGISTTASGNYSTATGFYTTASGFSSTAMGTYTTAKSRTETVVGQFNDELPSTNTGTWSGTNNDRVFTVGTGTSASDKKTAFSVLQDGSVKIGSNGSNNKTVYTATAALGSSGSQKVTFTITHNKAIAGTQAIVATVSNQPGTNYTDAFSVTIANVTANSFDAVVYRLDGTSWGQTPQLNYTITEQ